MDTGSQIYYGGCCLGNHNNNYLSRYLQNWPLFISFILFYFISDEKN